jgi:protein SMG8
MHFAKDVEKLITGTEDLSLGPDENEFPALSVDHLSQVAADDHEDSQTSLGGKGEAAEAIDEENMIEITGTHEQPTISTRDFSTTEYLPCMLHVHSPVGILPRYSSWSLVCLGSSSLYSHNAGIGSRIMTWFVKIKLKRNSNCFIRFIRSTRIPYRFRLPFAMGHPRTFTAQRFQ